MRRTGKGKKEAKKGFFKPLLRSKSLYGKRFAERKVRR